MFIQQNFLSISKPYVFSLNETNRNEWKMFPILILLSLLIAECSPGRFGKNCEQNCSDNCEGDLKLCNGTTGECVAGCRPGYDGLKCGMGKGHVKVNIFRIGID